MPNSNSGVTGELESVFCSFLEEVEVLGCCSHTVLWVVLLKSLEPRLRYLVEHRDLKELLVHLSGETHPALDNLRRNDSPSADDTDRGEVLVGVSTNETATGAL